MDKSVLNIVAFMLFSIVHIFCYFHVIFVHHVSDIKAETRFSSVTADTDADVFICQNLLW